LRVRLMGTKSTAQVRELLDAFEQGAFKPNSSETPIE